MAIQGLRKIIDDVCRNIAGQAMEAGLAVRVNDTVDADSGLPNVVPATSGSAKLVGILLDTVVARPAEAEDSTSAGFAGIHSDYVFTEATPLFQEAGNRFVGEEVAIMRQGLIRISNFQGTPSGGLLAFVTVNGYVTAHPAGTGIGQPIGVWQSATGTDGYAELYVNTNQLNA